jgi:limonene 1,2-monooxygenase
MLGVGPGSLPTDAAMIGVAQAETRELMEQSVDVILQLLRSDEPVTFKNTRWDLRDARLHLRPYSNPLFDVAVAAVASPGGPRVAGKHGVGLLSIGATQSAGFDALAMHWDVMEERARTFGTTVDRAKWRLVGLVHCAETKEQAFRDVEFGIEQWFNYFQTVAAFPQMAVTGNNVREMIDFVNGSGLGAIGTPDMCGEQIERLVRQSNGGFGAYLMLAHEWATPEATRKNYELIARHVMPQFQGQASSTLQAKARAEAARPDLAAQQARAVQAMSEKHKAEMAARAGS